MRKALLKFVVIGAAISMLPASAFAQSGSQSGSSLESQSDKSADSSWKDKDKESGSASVDSGRELSPTGRTSGQAIRASQLIGSQLKDSSGQQVGNIEDIILNPASGKIDFAVISLSSSQSSGASRSSSSSSSSGSEAERTPGSRSGISAGGPADSSASASGASSSSPSTSASSASLSGQGKLVAVPWSLLQPDSAAGSSIAGIQQQSFKLSIDRSKLEQAPTLNRGQWSEINQPTWRQRVFSHFGVSESATGGAESPAGTTQGSGARDLQESPTRPERNP